MRALRPNEVDLLKGLIALVPESERPVVPDHICAVDLSDGGMGSIRFVAGPDEAPRRMGRELVTVSYTDEGQVPVSISLNLDQDGSLFEIDIWKVDFSPLRRYPRPADLHRVT
jgi:hypothetical protein